MRLTLKAIWKLETAMPRLDVSIATLGKAQMRKWMNIAHNELGGRSVLRRNV